MENEKIPIGSRHIDSHALFSLFFATPFASLQHPLQQEMKGSFPISFTLISLYINMWP